MLFLVLPSPVPEERHNRFFRKQGSFCSYCTKNVNNKHTFSFNIAFIG